VDADTEQKQTIAINVAAATISFMLRRSDYWVHVAVNTLYFVLRCFWLYFVKILLKKTASGYVSAGTDRTIRKSYYGETTIWWWMCSQKVALPGLWLWI
jgi:hypothetical protein